MKIIRLTASNIKRVVAVEIQPDGSLVRISGKNGAGKSSTIDAIQYALAGKSAIPAEPVRKGQRRGKVELELDGGLSVVRTFTPDGPSKLVVTDETGQRRSPQALLDSLCGKLWFDPLEYSRMPAKQQAEILRQLAGVDTTLLDAQRAKLFERRTDQNREVKRLQARLAVAPKHDEAPAEEVSVAQLTDELEQLQEQKRANDEQRAAVAQLARTADDAKQALASCDAEIVRLEEQLAKLRAERDEREQRHQGAVAAWQTAGKAADELQDPDLAAVREQLKNAENVNRQVRDNRAREELRKELAAAERAAEKLSDAIADIDEQKRAALEAASFPVDGLGFDEAGVTLQGVPLEQASQAERLRVSVAIGLAANPKLRVLLVRDGSLLDEDSLRMLGEMAEAADAQVWLERVDDDDPSCIVIEDGMVREQKPRAEADTEEPPASTVEARADG